MVTRDSLKSDAYRQGNAQTLGQPFAGPSSAFPSPKGSTENLRATTYPPKHDNLHDKVNGQNDHPSDQREETTMEDGQDFYSSMESIIEEILPDSDTLDLSNNTLTLLDCSVDNHSIKQYVPTEAWLTRIVDGGENVWTAGTEELDARFCVVHFDDVRPVMVHISGRDKNGHGFFKTLTRDGSGWNAVCGNKYGEFPDGSKPDPSSLIPFSINISSSKNGVMAFLGSTESIKTTSDTVKGVSRRILTPKYGYNANEVTDGPTIIWKSEDGAKVIFVKAYPEDNPTLVQFFTFKPNGETKYESFGKTNGRWEDASRDFGTRFKELKGQ